MRAMYVLLLVLALGGGLMLEAGCGARDHREMVRLEQEGTMSTTRPVVPVEEEEGWNDKAGEIAVIIVGIGLIVLGAALPFLLL